MIQPINRGEAKFLMTCSPRKEVVEEVKMFSPNNNYNFSVDSCGAAEMNLEENKESSSSGENIFKEKEVSEYVSDEDAPVSVIFKPFKPGKAYSFLQRLPGSMQEISNQ